MKHINELQTILNHQLNWNKARVNCLTQIVQALCVVRTINLTQVAAAFQNSSKRESSYRRICRFFTSFAFNLSLIIPIIFGLLSFGEKYTLILDRTNWKWGKTPINILLLSIAYKGISIPLFWSVLDLEGSSCVNDRMLLLKRVLDQFGPDKIDVLLADREFVGKEWFDFLVANRIPFLIRIKESYLINPSDQQEILPIAKFIKKGGRRKKWINSKVEMWGFDLHISIRRRRKEHESMILISNTCFNCPFERYKNRWKIETLFGCLKGRGFRIEDTHITDPDKIERVIFVLTIAFLWAYVVGENELKCRPLKVKKHGRKEKSLFRRGLDYLQDMFMKPSGKTQEIKLVIKILNPLDTTRYGVCL